jgi:hypothetical protein
MRQRKRMNFTLSTRFLPDWLSTSRGAILTSPPFLYRNVLSGSQPTGLNGHVQIAHALEDGA